jgi:hypothetical protein
MNTNGRSQLHELTLVTAHELAFLSLPNFGIAISDQLTTMIASDFLGSKDFFVKASRQ